MKKHILLVEYDSPTIELIQDILSSPVFVLDLADEGEKAKEMVKKKKYDLIITAAMLPKFHGFNLSQFIATSSPRTKIIIISGIYKGIEYKHQAVTQYRADEFVEKPLNRDHIKKRVLELLDINEKDLKPEGKAPATAVPLSDTAKIPVVPRTREEKNKYSSSDLFGDIIEEVEKIPAADIEAESPDKPGKKPPEKEAPKAKPAAPRPDIKMERKIETELASLLKEKKEVPDSKKFKKIEDDISKKLEDTLSGLGLKSSTAPPKPPPEKTARPKPEPAPAPPEPEKDDKQEAPPAKPSKHKERADELGDYDILGLIARGGMAEIYKAKRKGVKGFEKIIAIKKILSGYGEDDKYVEMFVDEAKIAAELSHPNIVQIYDLGKKDDYYFIAMEYIQGKDLRVIMNKLNELNRWIPEELSVYLVINVLEALGYAHAAKDNRGQNLEIVHRDISPPNILISLNGDIKITDFGVSKASIKIHQTISGALKGKLLYMSPEQAKGEKNIDSRSDLYSVGVLLFELITRRKLFMDTSEMGVLKKVQNGKLIAPSEVVKDIHPELERIILKSLHKEREQRYQAASEMVDDLEVYLKNNFDHIPTSLHVAHFLHDLFETEIEKEFTKVDLKPLPFEIKRKPGTQEKPEFEEPEAIEVEVAETEADEGEALLLQEDRIIEEQKPEPEPAKEVSESAGAEEKFTPTIEIDFEKPRPIKDHRKPESKAPTTLPEPDSEAEKKAYRPSFIEFDSLDKKKEKKRKRFLFFSILLMFMMVVAAGYYFLYHLPARRSIEPLATPADSTSSRADIKTAAEENPFNPLGDPSESVTPPLENQTESQDSQAGGIITPMDGTEETREPLVPEEPDLTITPKREETKPAPAEIQKPRRDVKEEPPRKEPEVKKESLKSEDRKQTVEQSVQQIQEEKKETPAKTIPETETKPAPEEPKPRTVEPPPVIKPGQIVAEMALDSKPVPLSTPLPRVSKRTRKALVEDQHMLVSILIDHNGNIEKVKLLKKSSLTEINSLIISSLAEWKYRPAVKNNIRVKTWKQIPITINKE